MKFEETIIKDCFLINPIVYHDSRGYFFESFSQKIFYKNTGIKTNFIQDNQSLSQKGVIRGLHTQLDNFAQSKLIRVLSGKIIDIVVDYRKDSESFGQKLSTILSSDNFRQLYIPKGCLHGFAVLSQQAVISYKCDNYYNKASEAGVIFNDKTLNINWQIDSDEATISEKDKGLPTWSEFLEKLNMRKI
uniref:dTDP-4-dehydrorhamnose 3,5-epimerase n=1 Tax=Ornithobacterium rhinotracheale TaxID=28251 RepID=UPI0039A67AA5